VRTYRLHLKSGLSAEKYERLTSRLGICRKAMTPVRGGGRSLVVAIDVRTGTRDAVEYFAANRVWMHKSRLEGRKPVRMHVAWIEDVTDSVTPAEAAAS
jgi:hypothetical protein